MATELASTTEGYFHTIASSLYQPFKHSSDSGEAATFGGRHRGTIVDILLRKVYTGGPWSPLVPEDIHRLLCDENTRSIIVGLACALDQRNGRILILSHKRVKQLMPVHNIGGYYDGQRTIVLSEETGHTMAGLLVHEAIHFILEHFTGCEDPAYVVACYFGEESDGSADAEIEHLDSVVQGDCNLRRNCVLWVDEELRCAANYLDAAAGKTYFVEGCDIDSMEGRRLLRVETVVRYPQLLTIGHPHADLRKIAPELQRYFEVRMLPALEKMVQGGFDSCPIDACLSDLSEPQHEWHPATLLEFWQQQYRTHQPVSEHEMSNFAVSSLMQGFRAFGGFGDPFHGFKSDLRVWLKKCCGYEWRREP